MIPDALIIYITSSIIPKYDSFDGAHDRRHVLNVIKESLHLASLLDADDKTAYTIAAYHDIGMAEGRENHHLSSGRMLSEDENLKQWFNDEEIQLMKEAVEDHRASSETPPRSLYGMIIADADRELETETILRRTLSYNLEKHNSKELAKADAIAHLERKYGESGYIKFYLPQSEGEEKIKRIRKLIADKEALSKTMDSILDDMQQ